MSAELALVVYCVWWVVSFCVREYFHRDPIPGEPILLLDSNEYHASYRRATEGEKRVMRRAALAKLGLEFIHE